MANRLNKILSDVWRKNQYLLTYRKRIELVQCASFRTSVVLKDTTRVNMPSLSPTMESGTIIKWHKQEGDKVNPGDMLCEVQTDKAVVSFDTEEEGILAKIIQPENETIAVGTLIALLVEEGDDWKNVQVPQEEGEEQETAQDNSQLSKPQDSSASAPGTTSSHTMSGIGPAVRSLLEIYKINPLAVVSTGPNRRLLKGDILRYVKEHNVEKTPMDEQPLPQRAKPKASQPSAPTPTPSQRPSQSDKPSKSTSQSKPKTMVPESGAEFDDLPLTSVRKVIAKRLTESKTTIPHVYASIDSNIEQLLKTRQELLSDGVKVSVNDFIIKAAAVALREVPAANAVWRNGAAELLDTVDISVAVATDSGLITPIVQNADTLGLEQISNNVRDLSTRARDGKLQLHEFQGGSFTISNLGMFGISEFSAVINPPQACILAVGGARILPGDDGSPTRMLSATLSWDGRVLNEHEAARFLHVLRLALEQPKAALLGVLPPVHLQEELS